MNHILKPKKIIFILLKIGLVVGIFYYLIQSGKLDFSKLQLFVEHPLVLVMIVAIIVCFMVPVAAFRWWLLLRAMGLHAEYLRTLLLTWIGNFFNTTLPGAISGDVVKGYYIINSQRHEGKTKAFTSLLIDRFVGLFGLIVMAFCALLFNAKMILSDTELQPIAGMIIGLFVGTIVFYTIVTYPFKEGKDPFILILGKLPGGHFLVKIYSAFKIFQHQKTTLVLTLAISVVLHSTLAFIFLQIAQLIGIQNMDLANQLFIMPIGLITVAIPLAPGGMGVGHVAFDWLYMRVGIQGGADIFNLYVVIQLAIFLLGGIPYFLHNKDYQVPKEDEDEMLSDEP